MLTYPNIDPIIFQIGPLAIRWYSLAYLAGVLLGAWYIKYINNKPPSLKDLKPFDDLMFWAVIGIVIGGRIGYTIFYHPVYYLSEPIEILKIWKGGMSFHGGLIGLITGLFVFAKKNSYPFLAITDLAAVAAPIGLFFGRIANFINGELYGRVTDVPWAIVFPNGGPLPRHPSQLYEACTEGLLLFTILCILAHFKNIRKNRGMLSGFFLLFYSISRITMELFRQPDDNLGFIFMNFTMGQILSVPMLLISFALLIKRDKQSTNSTDKKA